MAKNRTGVLLASFLTIAVSLTLSAVPAQAVLRTIDGPNATETDCNDVNDANVVVGFYVDSSGVDHGFVAAGRTLQTVNVPGSTGTLLYGINNHNDVVGWYTDSQFTTHGVAIDSTHKVRIIDPPGSEFTNAWSINDAGVVVGAYIGQDGIYHGFRLSNGSYTSYDAPNGATLTEFTGINNNGDMVGIFDDSTGVEHGFALVGGNRFIQIDDPNADGVVTATDRVNDHREYVGLWSTSTTGPFNGYHAQNNVFTTITFPGSTETRTRGLNNSGVVAGRYTDQNGVIHGYVGIP